MGEPEAGPPRRAEEKYELFIESISGQRPTGEFLRERNLSSTELSRIRAAVRKGAMVELSRGRGRPRKDAQLKEVRAELARVNSELFDMAVQNQLLKAKEGCGLAGPIRGTIAVPESARLSLIEAVEVAKAEGVPVSRSCAILQLPRQRFYAWRDGLAGLDTSHPTGEDLDGEDLDGEDLDDEDLDDEDLDDRAPRVLGVLPGPVEREALA